ncbi:MAG: hypothetical protein F6J86_05665 [Symploca sp. SIO1B1]|nr:hypothetical protein [Symploca sp. SIO1C2]NER93309.1 hypothetical protein [Symploca sp. SIO1B1]
MTFEELEELAKEEDKLQQNNLLVKEEDIRQNQRLVAAMKAARLTVDQASLVVNSYFKRQAFEKIAYNKIDMSLEKSVQWNIFPSDDISISEEKKKLIEVSRLLGPRWNAFAFLAFTYLFQVTESLRINSTELNNYSDSWAAVIYSGQKTIATISSMDLEQDKVLQLEKGLYHITYRFYTDGDDLYCPEVTIDDKWHIPAYKYTEYRKKNDYMFDVIEKNRHSLYLWQQYYVFHWLKNITQYDEKRFTQEWMPVPNPDTYYSYGYLEKGQGIQMKIEKRTMEKFRIYVMFLNQMSIPILRERVREDRYVSPRIREDGAYFIRFVYRGKLEEVEPAIYMIETTPLMITGMIAYEHNF